MANTSNVPTTTKTKPKPKHGVPVGNSDDPVVTTSSTANASSDNPLSSSISNFPVTVGNSDGPLVTTSSTANVPSHNTLTTLSSISNVPAITKTVKTKRKVPVNTINGSLITTSSTIADPDSATPSVMTEDAQSTTPITSKGIFNTPATANKKNKTLKDSANTTATASYNTSGASVTTNSSTLKANAPTTMSEKTKTSKDTATKTASSSTSKATSKVSAASTSRYPTTMTSTSTVPVTKAASSSTTKTTSKTSAKSYSRHQTTTTSISMTPATSATMASSSTSNADNVKNENATLAHLEGRINLSLKIEDPIIPALGVEGTIDSMEIVNVAAYDTIFRSMSATHRVEWLCRFGESLHVQNTQSFAESYWFISILDHDLDESEKEWVMANIRVVETHIRPLAEAYRIKTLDERRKKLAKEG